MVKTIHLFLEDELVNRKKNLPLTWNDIAVLGITVAEQQLNDSKAVESKKQTDSTQV